MANNAFERALVTLHKMPVVWCVVQEQGGGCAAPGGRRKLAHAACAHAPPRGRREMYLAHLVGQRFITRTRRAFDRALQALPITQHERIWTAYVPFAKAAGVPATAVAVFRRRLQLEPGEREAYVEFLRGAGLWGEAAGQLAALVNDASFVSPSGTTPHALWMALCGIISAHPGAVGGLPVEAILRSGLARFTDEVGRLWVALAAYFIRQGHFERARDVYEEGIQSVITVRDFALVFDAYAQFEETLLAAKMEAEGEEGDADSAAASEEGEEDVPPPPEAGAAAAALAALAGGGDDVELRLRRLERLMDRRPVLLSSVLLRQNPHNVAEWHKRAELFKAQGRLRSAITTYSEALKAVAPHKALGRPHTLWLAFATLYEEAGDAENAAVVLRRAVAAPARSAGDLAALYIAWAELHLRAGDAAAARAVMAAAVKAPARGEKGGGGGRRGAAAAGKVHKDATVWALHLDLEENLGALPAVKAAYERCIDLGVATPAIVLNYAGYLAEREYHEDSFRAFEKGIAAFGFPHAGELWVAYITAFVARYGGSKLERLRELCESAVTGAPPGSAKPLYLLYASLEERHGLMRRALRVYQRAAAAVAPGDAYEVYLQYIARTGETLGLPATRPVFEEAVARLPEAQVKDMCLRFAAMERSLGEVDRARAILAHAAQFAAGSETFWATWHDFEVEVGNAETYKDMRRVRRSVELAAGGQRLGAAAAEAVDITDAALAAGNVTAVAQALGASHPDAEAELAVLGGVKRGREARPAAGAVEGGGDAAAVQAARIAAALGEGGGKKARTE